MIWRINGRVTAMILVIMTALVAFMSVRVLIERHNLQSVNAVYRLGTKNGPISLIDGRTQNGQQISIENNKKGWVVRYASRFCGYCRKDEQWKTLAPKLHARGFQLITLLPSAEHALPYDDLLPETSQQVAYAHVEWIKRIRLNGTPTILIFDANQHLIWHRTGMLTVEDTKNVLKKLGLH